MRRVKKINLINHFFVKKKKKKKKKKEEKKSSFHFIILVVRRFDLLFVYSQVYISKNFKR
jgi:hypothetical protein